MFYISPKIRKKKTADRQTEKKERRKLAHMRVRAREKENIWIQTDIDRYR